MPHLRLTDVDEATGLLKEEYDAAVVRAGKVFNILKAMSLRPAVLRESNPHPILALEADDVLKAMTELRESPDVLDAVLFGRSVHVTVKDQDTAMKSLGPFLAARGITVRSIEPVTPTLEDVVVSLITAAGGARED